MQREASSRGSRSCLRPSPSVWVQMFWSKRLFLVSIRRVDRWTAVSAPPSGPAASRPPRAVCVSGSEQTEETVELYREDVSFTSPETQTTWSWNVWTLTAWSSCCDQSPLTGRSKGAPWACRPQATGSKSSECVLEVTLGYYHAKFQLHVFNNLL